MNPPSKLVIVGAGIIGAMEAYYAYLAAQKNQRSICITINEKNARLTDTTVTNICASLTPDEILAVLPQGTALEHMILVDNESDITTIKDSISAKYFFSEVKKYNHDKDNHEQRISVLRKMGKLGMDLWKKFYDDADSELKEILKASNFHAVYEPQKSEILTLLDGYRIDLIYKNSHAKTKVEHMLKTYQALGYCQSKILTPDEVEKIDATLANFSKKEGVLAVFRPGGYIDAAQFLPKFYNYLKKLMGTYTNAEGKIEDCFQLKFNHEVSKVIIDPALNQITGYKINSNSIKQNQFEYDNAEYVFAPGESVGLLSRLGFNEPAYAGFAGPSLKLQIPIPANQWENYAHFQKGMEVHHGDVVLALQASTNVETQEIFLGVAGTNAFYGDKQPHIEDLFVKNSNLLQLNIINDVFPDLISMALKKDTHDKTLNEADLHYLEGNNPEGKKIAQRWVGNRAVAYDGFPTLGAVYNQTGLVKNARVTTHLGSGGVSLALISVLISRYAKQQNEELNNAELLNDDEKLWNDVIAYAQSSRKAQE